ncbi:MAG: cytochrome c biogenesis protein CcdA [Candidatus Cryptobacteroides sp.]|jgi:thiol:disulfide interchange protein DsbD|nr:cytochrome c biogenesis protein CcdA [Candidatus Cryptobacteroides sp.]
MSLLFSALVALLLQLNPSVVWKAAVHHTEGDRYQLVVTGQIGKDYYVHPMSDPHVGTELEVTATDRVSPDGKPVEEYTPSEYKGAPVVVGTYVLKQELLLSGSGKLKVEGNVVWSACSGDYCQMPEEYSFSVPVEMPGQAGHDGAQAGNLWSLILEAILWGFLMLLTPCVFPMVPMTVSFFIKQEKGGRFKALMYGVFIVLLYTVPICLIIGLTWLLGGETVTADIFNWLSTHWLPNILFFVIFMLFAASFFGAFEITLPSSWTTQADAKSDKGGLLGVFFLALTLVLVSFSCTGPIVGTVLIKSTQGEFWTPMVTMLAFSIAFSLPFALLAFFPSVLKKLPKSGGWLNSVKVVLGFVEVALGLKFLSTADQTYHWHLLDREVYLAIWIVCFALLGLYLLGKIRFKHDSPLEYIGVGRLALVIADFAFVLYLLPGMWGAPLKALSGYLPPLQTQDFVLGEGTASTPVILSEAKNLTGSEVSLPHGLTGYSKLEDGLAAAKEQGKKVFVDITGHGCVNCREMEARVWSDPRVLQKLQQDYVIVSLYVDDKTKLPESEWITTDKGKVLKDVGRVNSHLVLERFGVNSQPNYFLLDGEGNILRGPRGYNLDTDAFVDFLTL